MLVLPKNALRLELPGPLQCAEESGEETSSR